MHVHTLRHTRKHSGLSTLAEHMVLLRGGSHDRPTLNLRYATCSKYGHNVNVVADRFSHMRKLARPLLEKLTFTIATKTQKETLLPALEIVRDLIGGKK